MTDSKNSGMAQLNYIMSILTMFEKGKPELSVTDIAQQTGLSKGAVSRNLQAMAAWDLVSQDPVTRRYSLGMKLFQLGSAVDKVHLLCERARPFMERLAKTTHKTIGLMVRHTNQAVSVFQVDPDQWPLFSHSIGRELPLFVGSSPKTLLAYCPDVTQVEYLNSSFVKSLVADSKVDIDKLRNELENVRKTGYCISQGEVDPGIMSVSVPIWGSGDEPIAVLGVLWAESNTSTEQVGKIIKLAQKASEEISRKMGFHPLDNGH